MYKIYIEDSKFSAVISEIVGEMTELKFGDNTFIESEEQTEYTEEAQEFFNNKFDELEGVFNCRWNLHSSSMLEIEQE